MLITGSGWIGTSTELLVRRGPWLRHILHLFRHCFGFVPVLFNLKGNFIQSRDNARPPRLIPFKASLSLHHLFNFLLISELFLIVWISCMTCLFQLIHRFRLLFFVFQKELVILVLSMSFTTEFVHTARPTFWVIELGRRLRKVLYLISGELVHVWDFEVVLLWVFEDSSYSVALVLY